MSKRFTAPFWRTNMDTPIGRVGLTATAEGLAEIWFDGYPASAEKGAGERDPAGVLERARAQLEEYFAGSRLTFDLPLAPSGTAFELEVWDLLRKIPAGQTASYGQLARKLGDVTMARAVGRANGQNPLPIVVPCHRVIGVDGSLVGFGGGLERKKWLLEHEGALARSAL
ncbi:MAG TPA: methylated-DNA--[protein]-cysteine S-methyltransferase [Gemmatimonadales bacterium]|jgi:methylated-DNA-[protein]-cysteine S-methyltransferase|nr:methylated-DNA--[protein]-cysteine S-methyltransferase [Gemmatimonadales bacterium]